MLINAESMTLIMATMFLLANYVWLDLHDNMYCWGSHHNADENLLAEIHISVFYVFFCIRLFINNHTIFTLKNYRVIYLQ